MCNLEVRRWKNKCRSFFVRKRIKEISSSINGCSMRKEWFILPFCLRHMWYSFVKKELETFLIFFLTFFFQTLKLSEKQSDTADFRPLSYNFYLRKKNTFYSETMKPLLDCQLATPSPTPFIWHIVANKWTPISCNL